MICATCGDYSSYIAGTCVVAFASVSLTSHSNCAHTGLYCSANGGATWSKRGAAYLYGNRLFGVFSQVC